MLQSCQLSLFKKQPVMSQIFLNILISDQQWCHNCHNTFFAPFMAIDYKRHTGTMSFIEEQLFSFLHASLSCQIVATCLKPEMALIYQCMTGLWVLFLCSHDIEEKMTLIFFARVWSLLWTATTGRGSQRPRRSSRKWWVVILLCGANVDQFWVASRKNRALIAVYNDVFR